MNEVLYKVQSLVSLLIFYKSFFPLCLVLCPVKVLGEELNIRSKPEESGREWRTKYSKEEVANAYIGRNIGRTG